MVLAISLLFAGCSERKNPVVPEQPSGLYYSLEVNWPSLENSVMHEFPGREIIIYAPPGYSTFDYRTEYPVVYLLHGFGGDQNYYRALFSLAALMDDLIGSGEIEPMIVVTPDASTGLGGSFYTNSPDSIAGYGGLSFGGMWEDYISEVIDTVDAGFHTIAFWRYRGISGHSMGGYGALRLAMTLLQPDSLPMFGSASSMSAPLAFYGGYPNDTTFLGFASMLPYVYQENGFTPDDTTVFYSISPGTGKNLTNMMFAMGVAFTPHDPANADTSTAHRFINPVTGVSGRIDLPFTADGELDSLVWQTWLYNDVTTLFRLGYGDIFDDVDLYLDAGDQDDYLFNLQTRYFGIYASDVINQDYYEIYTGTLNQVPANHVNYVGERLRDVMKFHDHSFKSEFEE